MRAAEGRVEYRRDLRSESPNLRSFFDSQPDFARFLGQSQAQPSSMTRKVIFFDIDGTLLSTGGAGQLAMESALIDEFSIDFPFEGVLTAGRTDRGITNEIFERYGFDNTSENRERFRDAYLSRLSESLEQAPGLLLPEVRPLLDRLHAIDEIELALLTGNYAEGAWIKLRHYQLDGYFSYGGFGDHNANRNDVARAAFNIAQQALGHNIETGNAMVIGDTPADIECARAIGASAVAVATGVYSADELTPHDADLLCHDFSDTDQVLSDVLKILQVAKG